MPRLQPRKKGRYLFLLAGVGVIAYLFIFPASRFSLGLQSALQRVLTPVSSLWRGGAGRMVSWYHGYFRLVGVQRENDALKAERLLLLEENLGLKEKLRTLAAGGVSDPVRESRTTARVVAYDPADPRQSLIVDKGGDDSVHPDDIVTVGGALVGRVLKVTPRFAQVLLLTDPDHSVGVTDERSRATGIVTGLKEKLSLNRERHLTKAEYLSGAEEIRAGDLLMTSGTDGVFPKGIPVGEVRLIQKDFNGMFWQAEVEPRVELSKIEFVQIVPGQEGRGPRDDG